MSDLEKPKNHIEWETSVVENRLNKNHILALAGKKARRKKISWIKTLAASLKKEIERWHYKKRIQPPDIEVAWIIHSQIAWKGPWASPETLSQDIQETDPKRVLQAEAEGPDSGSPIPQETLLLLKNVILEIEKLGHPIKNETFSKNWDTQSSSNTKGKKSVKTKKWTYKPLKILDRKIFCSSKLLSDFFELKT